MPGVTINRFCVPGVTINRFCASGIDAVAQAAATTLETLADASAFAALCLRFRRDLDAGPDRMNPNGGTIAMGHAYELERRGGRYGVAGVGGAAGLGVAVLVERVGS